MAMRLIKRLICFFVKHKPSYEGLVFLAEDGVYQTTQCIFCNTKYNMKVITWK